MVDDDPVGDHIVPRNRFRQVVTDEIPELCGRIADSAHHRLAGKTQDAIGVISGATAPNELLSSPDRVEKVGQQFVDRPAHRATACSNISCSENPFHSSPTRGTIVSMSSESLRTVRDRFSEFIERVQKHHERVVVTRNGTPAAVLMSPDDLESLEETLAVLEDSEAVAELVEAHRAYLEGDVVRGVEAVKALRTR